MLPCVRLAFPFVHSRLCSVLGWGGELRITVAGTDDVIVTVLDAAQAYTFFAESIRNKLVATQAGVFLGKRAGLRALSPSSAG